MSELALPWAVCAKRANVATWSCCHDNVLPRPMFMSFFKRIASTCHADHTNMQIRQHRPASARKRACPEPPRRVRTRLRSQTPRTLLPPVVALLRIQLVREDLRTNAHSCLVVATLRPTWREFDSCPLSSSSSSSRLPARQPRLRSEAQPCTARKYRSVSCLPESDCPGPCRLRDRAAL